ncbi:CobW family GTP-binding protein [Nocardia seriolae]|uniref:Cobalamin biosynthesis protein n=1 Tax=Nocardia seriolae TaxID=37332 RepID=A0A0B8N6C1_9NOCA|nr:CobW family GTP-binding protein [Nocardia seriolae]MTJ65318.1 GTP-binding protein [Nocardia seriolae]MTJ74133.1 GTP-binding protein [Nocardia seriolae]MTJ90203.1 GTP-binding protein [Nocardia seriolae]MTK34166.1 GTP-binding protein [Nocardia seriolae]MTK43302.1 GTP-binding protein [Nocardia seriolae]
MSRRIPVLSVAGFLGAGKTTLLNRLLRSRNTRIGVVVNDFGAVNIDAMLVAGQVDAMVSLGNGCVCCAVDVSELDELFDRLAHPRQKIDVIMVEASGLAEPRNLIRMVVNSDNPRIRYGGLVEVVDAEHFPDSRELHPELATHLRMADLVVLNKADRVETDALERLRTEITELVGQVPVYATSHGRIDPGLLFDVPARAPHEPRVGEQLSFDELLHDEHHEHGDDHECSHDGDCRDHRHLHDAYDSVAFTSDTDLNPRELIALLEDPPAGLFRAKGVLAFAVPDDPRKFVLHMVGRHIIIEPTAWTRHEPRVSNLVLIGSGLDEPAVLDRLRATAHLAVDPLDDHALLPVWRYVVEDGGISDDRGVLADRGVSADRDTAATDDALVGEG